jgi:hypothetical protein
MKLQEARELGDRIGLQVDNLQSEQAYAAELAPVLVERTPFRLLDAIGEHLGARPLDALIPFLDQIAAQRTMGGWVVIASALSQHLSADLSNTFGQTRRYVIAAGLWYAADIFGERVPGPALVAHFDPAVELLAVWREDPDPWVRRNVGVAVHYWAKQARGNPEFQPQAVRLLDLLAPCFTEREQDAIKGIGWGMKTLGRYFPALVAEWLIRQAGRPHRALMLRKATKYLPEEFRLAVRKSLS